MQNERRPKILYIAGAGRSGSTLLGALFGSIPSYCDVGEIHYLLDRGLQCNQLCACRIPMRECQFWKSIFSSELSQVDNAEIAKLLDLRNSLSRFRHLPLHTLNISSEFRAKSHRYGNFLSRLYSAIQMHTGSKVIIDSSKRVHGHVLSNIPNIDLYTVHLIRDSRASAYSWTRQKAYEPIAGTTSYMPTFSPITSSAHWMLDNLSAELLKRKIQYYLLVRYEDFVTNPQDWVKKILTFIGEAPDTLPFVGDRSVRLTSTHSVSGNPSRFKNGTVQIKEDSEWKTGLNQKDRASTTFLTWPLLKRYRYL